MSSHKLRGELLPGLGPGSSRLNGLEGVDAPFLTASGPGFIARKRGAFTEVETLKEEPEGSEVYLATNLGYSAALGADFGGVALTDVKKQTTTMLPTLLRAPPMWLGDHRAVAAGRVPGAGGDSEWTLAMYLTYGKAGVSQTTSIPAAANQSLKHVISTDVFPSAPFDMGLQATGWGDESWRFRCAHATSFDRIPDGTIAVPTDIFSAGGFPAAPLQKYRAEVTVRMRGTGGITRVRGGDTAGDTVGNWNESSATIATRTRAFSPMYCAGPGRLAFFAVPSATFNAELFHFDGTGNIVKAQVGEEPGDPTMHLSTDHGHSWSEISLLPICAAIGARKYTLFLYGGCPPQWDQKPDWAFSYTLSYVGEGKCIMFVYHGAEGAQYSESDGPIPAYSAQMRCFLFDGNTFTLLTGWPYPAMPVFDLYPLRAICFGPGCLAVATGPDIVLTTDFGATWETKSYFYWPVGSPYTVFPLAAARPYRSPGSPGALRGLVYGTRSMKVRRATGRFGPLTAPAKIPKLPPGPSPEDVQVQSLIPLPKFRPFHLGLPTEFNPP